MPWDQPWYVLRDLDGDNVAIVDTRGVASGQNAQLLTLAAEWRYDGVSLAGELALAIMNGESIEGELIVRAIGTIPGVSLTMFVANLAIQFDLSENAVAKNDDFETWYAGEQQGAQQAVSGPTMGVDRDRCSGN